MFKPAPVYYCTYFTLTTIAMLSTLECSFRVASQLGTQLHTRLAYYPSDTALQGYDTKAAFVRWEEIGSLLGTIPYVGKTHYSLPKLLGEPVSISSKSCKVVPFAWIPLTYSKLPFRKYFLLCATCMDCKEAKDWPFTEYDDGDPYHLIDIKRNIIHYHKSSENSHIAKN
ncbi:hypothetical protein RF11_16397 [Thelohanellus kitauei]|uniref:Uncharacterized protein n=1 Tax=Thelohanellus kitauei TaxID=669202 RepID=A0A0C2MPK6_THEKT|nr:hypothetical protein RF11_16397 [Thelohanellus kitauei]